MGGWRAPRTGNHGAAKGIRAAPAVGGIGGAGRRPRARRPAVIAARRQRPGQLHRYHRQPQRGEVPLGLQLRRPGARLRAPRPHPGARQSRRTHSRREIVSICQDLLNYACIMFAQCFFDAGG